MNNLRFQKQLRRFRELRGLTQLDLSKRSGIHLTAISHFETGERRPCLANLHRLCKAFRCTATDLLNF